MRPLTLLAALIALLAVSALPTPAAAQDADVQVDPDSPAGEYDIPLARARRESRGATTRERRRSEKKDADLFGEGVSRRPPPPPRPSAPASSAPPASAPPAPSDLDTGGTGSATAVPAQRGEDAPERSGTRGRRSETNPTATTRPPAVTTPSTPPQTTTEAQAGPPPGASGGGGGPGDTPTSLWLGGLGLVVLLAAGAGAYVVFLRAEDRAS